MLCSFNRIKNHTKMKILALSVFFFLTVFFIVSFAPKETVNQQVAIGKKLYETNCRSCHKLFDEFVGTPLYGTLERIPNKAWLYKYIRHSAELINKDAYAKCLTEKYHSLMQTHGGSLWYSKVEAHQTNATLHQYNTTTKQTTVYDKLSHGELVVDNSDSLYLVNKYGIGLLKSDSMDYI